MKLMKWSGITVLALTVAATPGAFAKNGNGKGQMKKSRAATYDTTTKRSTTQRDRFAVRDLNGDGVISRSEWSTNTARFDRLDTNRDGVLSRTEIRAAREQQRDTNGRTAQMRHRGMDVNGDGVITRSEWRGNDRSFEQHDRNDDGVLSGDEVRPGAQKMKHDRNHDRDDD